MQEPALRIPCTPHANNFLSGVYYVQTPPGAGSICFQDPRDQRDIIQPRFEETNQFNIVIQQVAVEAGTLVIFPSWLKHSVPPNPSKGERISISFNVMFSDYAKTISPPRWSGIPLQSGIDLITDHPNQAFLLVPKPTSSGHLDGVHSRWLRS